jgi:hypothetical protein
MVERWELTEKVDGTNVRVCWDGVRPRFAGRTDRAQMQTSLLDYLVATFTAERLAAQFPYAGSADADRPHEGRVVLFGEGYGAKIQKGGGLYRADQGFALFDVLVGRIWLERDSLEAIAGNLEVPIVPLVPGLGSPNAWTRDLAVELVQGGFPSVLAAGRRPSEGLVARTRPLLLDRMGRRVAWKLKARDFGA